MGGVHLSQVRFPVLGFEIAQTMFVEPLSDA
jgi:hypothetical protein